MESKAWVILTEEEKTALSLSIHHGKSTWQAGEILGRAHYKYIEIQTRARAFFEMFTKYFREFDDRLIPQDTDMTWDFQEFILCTIEERMKYRETLKMIGRESPLADKKSQVRIETLVKYMGDLSRKQDEHHRALFDLIKEFDRWNNFRILPECLQEPSAFKRRNKTRLIKHLKNIKDLEGYHIDRLISNFKTPKNYRGLTLYLPLVNNNNINGYEVVQIKGEHYIINHLSKDLHLYLFKEEDLADDYGFLVNTYLNAKNRTCILGQKFWPKYRTLVKEAYNYNEVNNIIPRRSNLVSAFRDLDKIRIKRAGSSYEEQVVESIEPAKRINSGDLWKL